MRAAEREAILDGISRQRKIVTASLRDPRAKWTHETREAARLLFRLSVEAQDLGISPRTIRAVGGLGVGS